MLAATAMRAIAVLSSALTVSTALTAFIMASLTLPELASANTWPFQNAPAVDGMAETATYSARAIRAANIKTSAIDGGARRPRLA